MVKKKKSLKTGNLVIAAVIFTILISGALFVKDALAEKSRLAALEQQRQELMAEADKLTVGYYYDEALALLQGVENQELKSEAFLAKIAEIEELRNSLTLYTGRTYHVFFHSLIIDTELAFDDHGHPANGYNMWMTTATEFKRMLPLLLANDFVLYDITKFITANADGTVSKRDIYLPPGKKPLVISIDDVNYYNYMKTDGFADRLTVDENGKLATVVKDRQGNESITYDGDVMPILDSFVEEHPEFSYRGAKGVVALTGYQGAFGYRISDPELYSAEQFAQLRQQVQKIADTLHSTGWQIACHSYTHNQMWRNGTMTMEDLKSDLGRFDKYIRPYVGEVSVFISPFGVHFNSTDPIYQYIITQGKYNIYCPVGASMTTNYYSNSMIQNRLNLDGYTMISAPSRILDAGLFDPALVLDENRPPLKLQ
ncbi:MAG: polysaccharide deacetylase family protein [Clostridia bacterium]|nr:polysaccharide deacetylase family protein [Clostridia bacterium]